MSAIMLTPIGLLLALATPSPALADLRELERFRGTWVRVEREPDDAARFAEIDRVTDSKSLLFRTLARAVMRRRTKPVDQYEVEYDGGIYWIRSNIGELYPLDGRPRAGAEADAVISWVEDGQIHQSWRFGHDSHGTAVWRLAPSGFRLTITEQVHGSHYDECNRILRDLSALKGGPGSPKVATRS